MVSHIVVTAAQDATDLKNNFCHSCVSGHSHTPKIPVHSTVHNLRANYRIIGGAIHTARVLHSHPEPRTRLSTADAHRDTPTVLGLHRFIPRFHSPYYCYSNIYS